MNDSYDTINIVLAGFHIGHDEETMKNRSEERGCIRWGIVSSLQGTTMI